MTGNFARIDHRPSTIDPNNALISIIIPAYNTAPYIHRAIESSIRQTHKNVEIIIVDDGSQDDTLKVAESFAAKDERVRVFHQNNAGVSAARNYGIREAHGEYLMFLDSDDWLEDDAAEFLLSEQIQHPDLMTAADIFRVYFDTENNNILRRKTYRETLPSGLFDVEGTIYASIKLIMFNVYPKIFRRDIIDENGISFHEGIHYGEDQLFVFSYLSCMKGTAFFSRPLLNYLTRPGSAMQTSYYERKTNVEKPFVLMINHPANTPAVKKAMKTYHASSDLATITSTIMRGGNNTAIHNVQKEAGQFSREFLASDKISTRKKIAYIIKVFFPVSILKPIVKTWDKIHKIREHLSEKNDEVISV